MKELQGILVLVVHRLKLAAFVAVLVLALAAFNLAAEQTSARQAAEFTASSPDGVSMIEVECTDGKLCYSLLRSGKPIISRSALSIIRDADYRVVGSSLREIDTTWKPVWGQFSEVRDHCREMRMELTADGLEIELVCRVYDNGIGMRFIIPEQSVAINRKVEFISEYKFAKPHELYHAPTRRIEHEPIGPIRLGQSRGGRTSMPAVLRADDNLHIGLLDRTSTLPRVSEQGIWHSNRNRPLCELHPQPS